MAADADGGARQAPTDPPCGHRNPLNCIVPDFVLANIQRELIGGADIGPKGGARRKGGGANTAAAGDGESAAGSGPGIDRAQLAAATVESLQLNASFAVARVGRMEALRAARVLRKEFRAPAAIAASLAGPQQLLVKRRTIFDAHTTQTLPGTKVRGEGDPATPDAAANEAYDHCGGTLDFFYHAYARNSINNRGIPVNSTVRFGQHYDNAFWNGAQMIYGDGDGQLFQRFTIDVDVVAHELTHGVTESEGGLRYWKQSGALNESISDVFGSLVKQFALNQTAGQADWLIGEDLFTPNVSGTAIRSLKAPGTAYDDKLLGKDPQPAHMRDYVDTLTDSGGVHINSGIPNHAFYLAATTIGGFAWERAGLVWYHTLLAPALRPRTQFTRFAQLTIRTAARLYGANSKERNAVRDAWLEVGVLT